MRSEKKARKTPDLEVRRHVARQRRKGRIYRVIARGMRMARMPTGDGVAVAMARRRGRTGRATAVPHLRRQEVPAARRLPLQDTRGGAQGRHSKPAGQVPARGQPVQPR